MKRNRCVAAAFAASAALVLISGVSANAAPNARHYRTYLYGAYSTSAACAAFGAQYNDPPEQIADGCMYYTTTPAPPSSVIGKGGPGWYLIAELDID